MFEYDEIALYAASYKTSFFHKGENEGRPFLIDNHGCGAQKVEMREIGDRPA